MQTITLAVSGRWTLDAPGHHTEAVDDRFLVFHARNFKLNLMQRADYLLDPACIISLSCLGNLPFELHALALECARPLVQRERLAIAFARILCRRNLGGNPEAGIADLLVEAAQKRAVAMRLQFRDQRVAAERRPTSILALRSADLCVVSL